MSKGPENERVFCKLLSRWWSEGLDLPSNDAIFWRTSISGGRATTRKKKGLKTAGSYGDVAAIDPIGQPLIEVCTIELKKGYTKQLSLLDSFDSRQKETLLEKFLRQVNEDAKNAGNDPVLVIHRDHHKPLMILCRALYGSVSRRGTIKIPNYNIHSLSFYYRDHEYIMLKQEEFLKRADPFLFVQIAKNRSLK